MGTDAAGFQPKPLDLLKIGWSIKQLQTTLIPAVCFSDGSIHREAISCTNYTSNNEKCGNHMWFTSKPGAWAHLGEEGKAASTRTQQNCLPGTCYQHRGLQTLFWESPAESTCPWKGSVSTKTEWRVLAEQEALSFSSFATAVVINWLISELCMHALTPELTSSCRGSLEV